MRPIIHKKLDLVPQLCLQCRFQCKLDGYHTLVITHRSLILRLQKCHIFIQLFYRWFLWFLWCRG